MGWKIEKDGLHIKDFFVLMWPHIKRFITFERGFMDFIGLHSFTNLFVEGARLSPYHFGHLVMVQTLISIIAILALGVSLAVMA